MVNLIFAMGIHRKRRVGRSGSEDLVNIECSKRTFWAAYTVDKYMSSTLGRPQAFHDEDIDLVRSPCRDFRLMLLDRSQC